jgi:epoxide hydrolase 4
LNDQYVKTNRIILHVVQDGPPDGPPVVLLHGFPEFWYGWRSQIPALVSAGYRVWAPDQRGYNLSDKPKGVGAYDLDQLAADVIGLIDNAGQSKASIVGHDWGGMVAWWLALKYPTRLERLAILNAPHPTAFVRHIRRSPAQLRRSLYAAFFQIPWLPETLLRRNNWRSLVSALRRTSRPETFTDADLDKYREAWSQPGAITAMLNWYRAARRLPAKVKQAPPRNAIPTLVIWGAKDFALGRELAQRSIDLCNDGRVVFLENASHWVQHEEPDRVNTLLQDFLV